ncbi:protein Wnt-11b-2-like [Macrosteles quadrilineatus]|uniref:protein Wnt-11b-2-like n=1 Tax=Macrosteles quadrilineatus TaxID=74068 RepID=UPI0023E26F29|nr:protein Wnt-11b-2-like [Macrosteles quadrilineatus]
MILGLHSSGNIHWNSSSACRSVRNSLQLSRRQTRLCRTSPEVFAVVVRAAFTAVSVCQDVLQDRRWNCSSVLLAPNFTPDLTSGTREQAFVYALASAAVTHAVARACSSGLLPQCSCASPPQEPPNGNFKWGGCGDNLRWASQFAAMFVDSSERHKTSLRYRERMRPKSAATRTSETDTEVHGASERTTMTSINLHNNRVGRRLVESSEQSQCKCHGVSGSCSIRTCWRALPSRLQEIATRLVRRYPHSVAVRVGGAVGWKLLPARPSPGPLYSPDDLLYLNDSPDYCHRDYRTGSVGTHGRRCNSSVEGYSSCNNMCCGRGYKTRWEERLERCHCKYYWCCYVKCKTCRTQVQVDYCN